jgi:ketosteroid isomerase-like protein
VAPARRGARVVTLTLEDRLDALELLIRADNAATARDASAYVALFTDDGVLDGAQGEYSGKEALLGAVSAIWASEGTASSHLTLNAIVENVDGAVDEAMATSTLLIVSSLGAVSPPTRIRQHLVKVDGHWLIKRRSVVDEESRSGSPAIHRGSAPEAP